MRTNNTRPTAISLFSGAGGLDLGFARAGAYVKFSNEMDRDAAATYCANPSYLDPSTMHVGDISQYLDTLSKFRDIDLLFGGPPCQGFSVAGKMNPVDTRSKLVFTFMDAVELVRPHVFVMENVKALARLKRWESVRKNLFERACSLRYGCALVVLNASDYGVPQARERMFLIGAKGLSSSEVEKLVKSGLSNKKKVPLPVREILSRLPKFGTSENPATCTAEIRLAKNPILRRSAYDGSLLFNGRGRPMDLDSVAKTLPAQMGGNHTPIVNQIILDDASAPDWIVQYHDGLRQGNITPAKATVPDSLRRLTVREAAALQTFPANYVFCGSTSKKYRQIGNAVPCALAEAVASTALEVLLPCVREQLPEKFTGHGLRPRLYSCV